LADALRNETVRNITERKAISYYDQFFSTYGNLVSVANGIYKLVSYNALQVSCHRLTVVGNTPRDKLIDNQP